MVSEKNSSNSSEQLIKVYNGDLNHLAESKTEGRQTSKSKRIDRKIFVLLFFSSIVLVSSVIYTFYQSHTQLYINSHEYHYGVIVDCGSTGSRAHIFKWPVLSGKPKSLHDIKLLRDDTGLLINKHITPGLSSFKDQPDGASNYMDSIMDFLNSTIPSESHEVTQVYFLATAGMRLLEKEVQKSIFKDIINHFKSKYRFPVLRAQVISGRMEGAFSWISLNSKTILSTDANPHKSFGMIELGGASAQVTFEITPQIEQAIVGQSSQIEVDVFRHEQLTFKLRNNETYRLFSTTFLGLGVNSARHAAVDLLIQDYLSSNNVELDTLSRGPPLLIDDPCLSLGAVEPMKRSLKALTHPDKHTSSSNNDLQVMIDLQGSGDHYSCKKLLLRILHWAKRQRLNCSPDQNECSMDLLETNFIPYNFIPFVGLSEMFFTTNKMMNLAGPYDKQKIAFKTQSICSTHYDTLREMHPHLEASQSDRVLRECFKATWMQTLLHHGLRMPEDYKNFTTVEQINHQIIDWTVGAMMKKALELTEAI